MFGYSQCFFIYLFSLSWFQDLKLKFRKGYSVGFHIGLFLWTICFIDFLSSRIVRARTGGWISRSLCFLFLDFPCGAMRKKFSVPHLLLIFRTCVTKAKILFWRPQQMCFNICRKKLSLGHCSCNESCSHEHCIRCSIYRKSVPAIRVKVCFWVCQL